jgi:head-tail adaptor
MSLFARNLAKCGKMITLQNRSITAPVFGTADFDERFSGDIERKAIIKTVKGKTFFDGVSTERLITHEICMEYEAGITAETWILFNGRRIDVLAVANCCESDKRLILTCSDRGVGEAAKI